MDKYKVTVEIFGFAPSECEAESDLSARLRNRAGLPEKSFNILKVERLE